MPPIKGTSTLHVLSHLTTVQFLIRNPKVTICHYLPCPRLKKNPNFKRKKKNTSLHHQFWKVTKVFLRGKEMTCQENLTCNRHNYSYFLEMSGCPYRKGVILAPSINLTLLQYSKKWASHLRIAMLAKKGWTFSAPKSDYLSWHCVDTHNLLVKIMN